MLAHDELKIHISKLSKAQQRKDRDHSLHLGTHSGCVRRGVIPASWKKATSRVGQELGT